VTAGDVNSRPVSGQLFHLPGASETRRLPFFASSHTSHNSRGNRSPWLAPAGARYSPVRQVSQTPSTRRQQPAQSAKISTRACPTPSTFPRDDVGGQRPWWPTVTGPGAITPASEIAIALRRNSNTSVFSLAWSVAQGRHPR
jgi:hypothetical protein